MLVGVAGCLTGVHARGAGELETRLMPLIQAHQGKVGVAVKNLKTGESFRYHADEPMTTASLIKFPIMVEAYRQAAEKKVDLDAPVTLLKADKVPGSGILTEHFSPGATFPLRDAVHLMIVFSDNTATNLVIERIGLAATATTMERMGYPNTKAHSKVYRRDTTINLERSKRFGLGSTTAHDMVGLLESLHKGELVSPAASAEMRKHLEACDDKESLPRFLPPGTKVAFKSGAVDASRTAAGIIDTPGGPVAVCVLTEGNADQRWVPDNAGTRLCADVARIVYDLPSTPAPTSAAH